MVFERAKRIRFSHCDPAGIIFYPRYAELLNEVVEDWFADGIGIDFRTLIAEHRLGVPVVRLECDFLAPARFGDTLTFRLAVSAVGGSSVQLAIEARRGETPCLRAALTIVLTSLDSFRAVPIDDLWRGRFAAFQAET
ncbi:acyl-CoA thioesterase [Sulfurivermis fontis]|uniref:acyl-CoA thioesterase n=1 Tax=Sulfurivermis fontis TaxID=1972068 RepID=UPI000FD9E5E6|nr:thioesterase family protein [Sulfurivermis fontis]